MPFSGHPSFFRSASNLMNERSHRRRDMKFYAHTRTRRGEGCSRATGKKKKKILRTLTVSRRVFLKGRFAKIRETKSALLMRRFTHELDVFGETENKRKIGALRGTTAATQPKVCLPRGVRITNNVLLHGAADIL